MRNIKANVTKNMDTNKENTFTFLKRIPYEQINREYWIQLDVHSVNEDWFKARGWTYNEYWKEYNNQLQLQLRIPKRKPKTR